MPRASSRSSSSACLSCSRASARSWRARVGIALEAPLDHAQLERERHEPLLGAVVQVALQSPPLGVPGLHDARARARELVVGVGVGQGLRDELGEVQQPPLGAGRQPLVARRRGDQHAPQPAADGERSGHRGAEAERAQLLGERSGRVVVVVDALGIAAAEDAGDDRVAVEVERRAQRHARHAGVPPAADHRRVLIALVAQHAGARGVEQARDLLGDRSKTELGGASPATSVAMRRRAACSSARARVASSLATRRCSASRDWVTSLIVETTPSGRPPASRTGAELIQTQAGVPSGRVSRAVSGACGSPVTSASSPRSRPPGTA